MQMLILLRVSICSPMVARSFTAQCLEDPYKQEEDLESTYQYIVVRLRSAKVFTSVPG